MSSIINGHMYQFSSISLFVGPRVFDHITSLSYSIQVDRSTFYGTSKEPEGVTRGNASYTASITMEKTQAREFIGYLTSLGVGGLSDTPFTITASYSEVLESPMIVDNLFGCRINSVGNDHSQGTEALTISMDIFVSRIELGGQDGVTPTRLFADEI